MSMNIGKVKEAAEKVLNNRHLQCIEANIVISDLLLVVAELETKNKNLHEIVNRLTNND